MDFIFLACFDGLVGFPSSMDEVDLDVSME